MGALPSIHQLSQILASYLPRYQAKLVREGLHPGSKPFCEEKAGVILLVDVSGFTALTERFAQRGAAGAEQLSGILNRYFGRVTELITAQGGDIIAFAGDSALAMWCGDSDDPVQDMARAAQAALDIQSELNGYVPADGVVLRQRAGIGSGMLRLMEVGGTEGRWQFVVTGEPIIQASLANAAAQPGDVVMDVEAARLGREQIEGINLESGLLKVSNVQALAPLSFAGTGTGSAVEGVLAESLRHYVPLVVADRLRAGQEQWIAEFRTLSVLFLNLADRDSQSNLSALHERVRRIQEIVRAYEGTLYQLLMDDKGLTAVCAFGLPPLAHEDDARRAVEAALMLRDELTKMGAATSAGIATGTVFCGVYGNDSRRQYTALGNTMNLAARLMQAAESNLFCDEATHRAAQSAVGLKFESKGEIGVKGSALPIRVFSLSRDAESVAIQSESPTSLEIVGRKAERAAFGDALNALIARGESGCIVVEGEAGIGKTRLLEEFARQANEAAGHAISCWRGAGDSILQATPYQPWRSVFREVLHLADVPPTKWRDHVLEQLSDRFSDRPELVAMAPLLNAVLPLDIPATPATSGMEGQALAANTQHLLVELLRSAAASSKMVLLLDDAHWFDSASWRMVLLAMQRVKPLLFVVSTRALGDPPQEFSQLLAMSSTQRFPLPALDADSTLQMVCQRLGVNRVPAEIARFIGERGKGHPLFSEQLGYALRDAGLVLIQERQCRVPETATGAAFDAALAALRFPSTMEGVITSRLDRLSPEAQLTVKVASVIGQRFSSAALGGVHPAGPKESWIGAHLDAAEKLELIQTLSGESGEYAFRQAITQEVAYNAIPFAQRRQIHRRMGEWLERHFESNLAGQYPLLAYHWRQAEDAAKAVQYCSEAGSQALRNNANQEAVRFLSEALEMHEKNGVLDSGQRAEWELQIGKAYTNWSKYIEARTHLERGLELEGQRVPTGNAGTAGALLGQVTRQLLHRAMPGRFVGLRKNEREPLLKFSRTFEALTEIYYLEDMQLQCLLAVFRSLNLAELAGSSPELVRGYSSAGALVGFMTLHKAANAYFELAESTCKQIDHPASRAWVSLARSMYMAGVGQWELADTLLREAMSINDRIGDRRRGDDNRMTLCTVQLLQGRFADSLAMADVLYKSAGDRLDARCQAEALRIKAYDFLVMDRMAELRDCVEELDSLRTAQIKFGGTHQKQDVFALTAILQMAAGNRQGAVESAERSVKVLSATSNNFFDYLLERSLLAGLYLDLVETDRSNAALWSSAQRSVKALQAYSRVFSIGRPLTAIHQGNFYWLQGKREKAVTCWQEALEYSARLKAPYYQGLAHASLGLHASDSSGRELHLQNARELLSGVGAVRDLARIQRCSAAKTLS